jgi:aspartate carbamoyltransferase catalytic subunit
MPRMAVANLNGRHLLALEGLSAGALTEILDSADGLRESASGRGARLDLLAGRTIANLFFEDSTRTRCSFTMAARRLGADTLDLTASGSSVKKGETIVDTALNIQAMGVHAFVVRASASGGPHMIAKAVQVPVINAGDGKHEHPTQGLLDLLTMRQRLGDVRGKTIAIVGDIANSRVARSNVHGLSALGANVLLIGPPTLVPKSFERIVDKGAGGAGTVQVLHDLDEVLESLDAIMMLRVQFERAGEGPPLITGDYREFYGLTAERAAKLPPHAIVMHPGPMNRGLEIDSEVADDPKRSVILEQVTNGVAVRMAVLARALCE